MFDKLEGRYFRTFAAVLEEKSFSKAAERLGYVQSTVTTQIRLLEEAASCKLFDRLPRGVEPTEAGRRLADFAYRFLKLGQELEEAMQQSGEARGTVRLRVLESFGAGFMGKVLQAFLASYPAIELQLETGFQQDTLDALLAERADLGIVPADPGRTDVLFEPLLPDELVWVASPKIAEQVEEQGWNALRELRLFGFGKRCMYYHSAEELLRKHRAASLGQVEFASLEMIKQAVLGGMGLALLPRLYVTNELGSGLLKECGKLERMPLMHGLVRLKFKELSRPAGLLRDHILQEGPWGAAGGKLVIE